MSGTSRRRTRTAGGLAALTLVAGGGALAGVVVPAGAAGTSLAEVGAASGITIGVAVQARVLAADAAYGEIVDREFASVTPEFDMRFDSIQYIRNGFYWGAVDGIVSWADAHGKKVRGAALLQGATQPPWFAGLQPAQARLDMIKHISTVMGRYQDKIDTWDVVSEAFLDSGVRRPSAVQNTGADWIEVAFRTARAAAPGARLCYSDYSIEDWSAPKTQAVYLLLKDLKTRGVPVDCISLQSHFTNGFHLPDSMPLTMTAFAGIGLDVELSELDAASGDDQPAVFAAAARNCADQPRCTGITVWGLRDSDIFEGGAPVLFDKSGQPKPAYAAFANALRAVCPTTYPTPSFQALVVPRPCVPPTTTTGPTTTTSTSTSPSTTTKSPKTTKTKTTKTKTTRTKKTTTVCRTRKKSQLTCKTVTRK